MNISYMNWTVDDFECLMAYYLELLLHYDQTVSDILYKAFNSLSKVWDLFAPSSQRQDFVSSSAPLTLDNISW